MRSGRVILAIYFLNIMALTDNLQAFYKLSDTSDSSGNNRTLTNNGNVSFAAGKIGNAAVFDGSNYLQAPINQAGIADFSISAWVNISSEMAWIVDGVTGSGDGFSYGGIELYYESGNVYFGAYIEGGNYVTAQTDINQWKHLAGTRTGGIYKLYIDGFLANTEVLSDSLIPGGNPIGIGANSDGTWGNVIGQIDAVGIWNRALSDAEVAELYNNGTGLELDGVAQPTLVKMQAPVKFFGKIKFGV
jgi:hypothetical protein